jgi:uncharacterized protein YjbI with pentapeptide repeats
MSASRRAGPDWVYAEVARLTAHRKDLDAGRLGESLSLLSLGVEAFNDHRARHPDYSPYLRTAELGLRLEQLDSLDGADLHDADLRDARLYGASLKGANLRGADLTDADLDEAQLENAVLHAARLDRATLEEAYMRGADFSSASLQRVVMDEADASFALFHNANLHDARLVQADLTCADFQGANLRGADLGAAQAEDTFWMGASLHEARMYGTQLSRADMSDVDLTHAMLIGTDLSGVDLRRARVYGTSVWEVDVEGARQENLVITPANQPEVVVDDLEVAQFVHGLLNHRKLRKAIMAVSARGVLLLGRFRDEGLELLQAAAQALRTRGYLPMLFDFDRPDDRSYTETVMVLAGLSRFIIADLSGPSVPQELYATVPHFKVPFVPILEAGRAPHGMAPDLFEYPWVITPVVRFDDRGDLLENLEAQVVRPAEAMHASRRRMLAELFGESR